MNMSQEILVADDDPGNRLFFHAALQRDGHRVDLCEDGLSALRKIDDKGARYTLLILDLQMPGRTGLEVITTLRARGETVPVILMSGTFLDAEVGRSTSPENVYRLAKPFSHVEMRAAILEMTSAVKTYLASMKGRSSGSIIA